MLTRVGWGLADQALSSLTNFVLGIIVARTVDAAAFGAFSFAFTAYAVGLGMNRSIATQPLVIRYSATTRLRWISGVSRANGITLWVGLISTLLAVAIALLTTGALNEAFLALAIVFPGLLLQDSWRYAFFAEGRAELAFMNDLVWTIALVPAMWASFVLAPDTVGGPLLAWGFAATLAGLIGYIQTRVGPRPATARRWLGEHRDLIPRFVGEFAISMAASLLSLLALGAIAGLAAAGILRAGGLLLGPLNILFQGVGLVAVPEGVGLLKRSGPALQRFAITLAVVLASAALAWGAVIYLLPTEIGVMLLGSNWEPAHSVIVPLTLGVAGIGVCSAALVALRALAAAGRSLRANAVTSVFVLVASVIGSVAAAASGAAWGYAIGNWGGAVAWWRETSWGFHERRVATDVSTAQPRADADLPGGW